jgi:hypothetical protein
MRLLSYLLITFSLQVQSSPHPGVGSSVLNQVDKNIFLSQMGIRLNSLPTGWELLSTTENDTNKDFLIELGKKFSMSNDHIGRISFKSEITKSKVNLELYVKKFLTRL